MGSFEPAYQIMSIMGSLLYKQEGEEFLEEQTSEELALFPVNIVRSKCWRINV